MWQSKKSQDAGPSSSTSNGKAVDEPDDEDIDIDDDLDIDELNELEASLSRTSIQIREPGEGTSSWAVLEDRWQVAVHFRAPKPIKLLLETERWSIDASGIDF